MKSRIYIFVETSKTCIATKDIIVIIQWSGIHRRAFLVNNCKDYYVDGTASPYVTKKNEFGM